MMLSGRPVLLIVGTAFTMYHAARSLFWTASVAYPAIVVAAGVLAAVTTFICMFISSGRPRVTPDAPLTAGKSGPSFLPGWVSLLALVVAAVTPSLVAIGVGADRINEPYATSYFGSVGFMLTAVMIRRRTMCAWIGVGILTVGSVSWLGLLGAFSYGLVGAFIWVGVAQIIVRSLDRAARDTVRLVELQKAAAAWQTAQSVRRRERRVGVQFALQVAGPLLSTVIAKEGVLTEEEKTDARVAEGTLRDELRAPFMMDDRVRLAIEQARRGGSTVTVLDEGGLEGLDSVSLNRIRGEIAEAIAQSDSARLIIRSSRHRETAVTIVGRTGAADGRNDEDAVDLWLEVARAAITDAQ